VGERPGHTLQASALVNEAYLRLFEIKKISWHNRAHFFAMSGRLMRRILVDHARARRYLKRGGGAQQVSLDEALTVIALRGELNLYRKLLSAPPGSEELLLSTSQPKFPMDWSPDGRFLLYDSFDPKRGVDIWALPLEGDRKPFEVVRTDFNERLAQISPDGTWIAYQFRQDRSL
jgi:hypothetical protein